MLKLKNKQKMMGSKSWNLIAATNPRSPVSEQYRTIRTNIQFSMFDKELKTLACTSAIPREGKSTTIANLAVTLAQQGQKVLLVDTDLRKPTIHQIMEVSNQYGFTGLITKKATKRMAILPIPTINNLYVLPSGPIPPNPSELLGSKVMDQLISELSEEYDIILFDTPPLLAVTDAQILGSRCDAVVLIVKNNRTEKKELVKAKELLDKTNVNLIGVIMNGADRKNFSHDYYYYSDEENLLEV